MSFPRAFSLGVLLGGRGKVSSGIPDLVGQGE